MVKKRVIGVVTIKDKWVVQSFGYKKHLPIGRPECVIQNLDRWGADEILIQIIDRSILNLGPDFELLANIAKLGISTPLIYSGGVRNSKDAVEVIKHGADRILIDHSLRNNLSSIREISLSLGSQAVIASIPVHFENEKIMLFDYISNKSELLSKNFINILLDKTIISEILLIDKNGEGHSDAFDLRLLDAFPKSETSIIPFGGIHGKDLINNILNYKNVSAIGVGNFLNYKEHSIQIIKSNMDSKIIRDAEYNNNKYIDLYEIL